MKISNKELININKDYNNVKITMIKLFYYNNLKNIFFLKDINSGKLFNLTYKIYFKKSKNDYVLY